MSAINLSFKYKDYFITLTIYGKVIFCFRSDIFALIHCKLYFAACPLLAAFFPDENFFVDHFLQIVYMRNNAYKAMAFTEALQRSNGLLQTAVIQRAEAFVDKHRIQLNAACAGLHLIRQAQRQRQLCHEGFAAA